MEASCSGSKEFDETRESRESSKNESENLGNPHFPCEGSIGKNFIHWQVDITALGMVPNITHVALYPFLVALYGSSAFTTWMPVLGSRVQLDVSTQEQQ